MISGDVVKLKSGGPEMVVESVNIDTRQVTCTYSMKGSMYRVVLNKVTLGVVHLPHVFIIYYLRLLAMVVLGFSLGRMI
jgi:uncharacterized protein YodC (DUF2158 family)